MTETDDPLFERDMEDSRFWIALRLLDRFFRRRRERDEKRGREGGRTY